MCDETFALSVFRQNGVLRVLCCVMLCVSLGCVLRLCSVLCGIIVLVLRAV